MGGGIANAGTRYVRLMSNNTTKIEPEPTLAPDTQPLRALPLRTLPNKSPDMEFRSPYQAP
jgi:hypothetical protein